MRRTEPLIMTIGDRQPETTQHRTAHTVGFVRHGRIDDGMHAQGPGVLLSPGTPTLQPSAPAPARALALDALRVTRLLHDPSRRPERWEQPGFGAEVEQIRRHLAPVRTRQSLAASYGREAFHLALTRSDHADPSPTRLAYALRWLELRDGATGPSWQSLLI
jgi:hypothetical protein